MTASVDFQVKYLTNSHVIARCLTILEHQCEVEFDGEDIENLPYAVAGGLVGANIIKDIVDDILVPSDYANSLNPTNRICLIASMDQGILYIRCEVKNDFV